MCITCSANIEKELLSYLVEHQDARDTVEGIVEWWLLEQEIKRRTTQVQGALAGLAAKGLVLEQKGKDARVLYRLNKRKLKKIRAFLDEDDR